MSPPAKETLTILSKKNGPFWQAHRAPSPGLGWPDNFNEFTIQDI